MRSFIKLSLVVMAVLGLPFLGCKTSSSSDPASPTPIPTNTIVTSAVVTLDVNGTPNTVQYTTLSTAVTWTFAATSSDGVAVTIASIAPTGSTIPTGMTITPPTVTFTPTQAADLTGSLTVTLTRADGAAVAPQTFYYTQNPSTTSSTCGASILATIMADVVNKTFSASSLIADYPNCTTVIQNLASGLHL